MDTKAIVIGGSIIAVAALIVLWRVRKDAIAIGGAAVEGAKQLGTAINPVNPDNAFAGAVNSVGSAISTNQSWTLGSWLYDVTHQS